LRREDSRHPGARPLGHRCAMFAPPSLALAVEPFATAWLTVLIHTFAKIKTGPLGARFYFGGGGGNRTRVRRFYVPGSTCIARCLISSRGNTTCEAHRRTSRLRV